MLVYCTVFVFMNIVQNCISKTTLFISDVFSHFLHTACGYTKIHFFMIKVLEQLKEKQLPLPFFFQATWREIQLSPCSLAITATPTALAPVTMFWRMWFFPFSTPFFSWWECHSMVWQCGYFFASPRSLTSSYTWRILWLQMSSWPSHSLSRFATLALGNPNGLRIHWWLIIKLLLFHRLFVSILMFFLIVLSSKKWLWAWVVNIIKQTNLLLVSQNHEFWTTKKSSKKWLVLNCKPLMNKHLLTLKIRFLIREFPVREN